MSPETSVDPKRPGSDLAQVGVWVFAGVDGAGPPGISSGGGGFLQGRVCYAGVMGHLSVSVCSRRDLEIERPMPGAHTVTLQ